MATRSRTFKVTVKLEQRVCDGLDLGYGDLGHQDVR